MADSAAYVDSDNSDQCVHQQQPCSETVLGSVCQEFGMNSELQIRGGIKDML